MPTGTRLGTAFDRREQQELDRVLALSARLVADGEPLPALFVPPTQAVVSLHGTLPPTDDSSINRDQVPNAAWNRAAVESASAGAVHSTRTTNSANNHARADEHGHKHGATAAGPGILVPNTLSNQTAGSHATVEQRIAPNPQSAPAVAPAPAQAHTGLTVSDIDSFSSPFVGKAQQDLQRAPDMSTIDDSPQETLEKQQKDQVSDSEGEESGSGSAQNDPFAGMDDEQAELPLQPAAAPEQAQSSSRQPNQQVTALSYAQNRQTVKEAGRTASRPFIEVKVPVIPSRQSSINTSRANSLKQQAQSESARSDEDDDDGLRLRPQGDQASKRTSNEPQTDRDDETMSTKDKRSRKKAERQKLTEVGVSNEYERGLASTATSLSKLPESTESNQLMSSMNVEQANHEALDLPQALQIEGQNASGTSKKSQRKNSKTFGKDRKQSKSQSESKRKRTPIEQDNEEFAFDEPAPDASKQVDEAIQDVMVGTSSGPRSSSRKNKGKGRKFADEDLSVAAKTKTQESAAEMLSSPVKPSKRKSESKRKKNVQLMVVEDDDEEEEEEKEEEEEEETETEQTSVAPADDPESEVVPEQNVGQLEETTKKSKKRKAVDDEAAFADDEPLSGEEDKNQTGPSKAVLSNKDANTSMQRTASFGSREVTPIINSKKKSSLANVLTRTGCYGARPTGLSARVKIPRLHANLKPPPPPKPAMPKEKVKKKKGHESYSDEEKKWYEVKPVEDWDSDDHVKWQRHVRRKEKGLASSDDDGWD
ncbi:hypothetical protein ACM66B_005005 [Microbotryomycetes sp. NB124-2]